ncbi:MAG: hypothetical protein R2706_17325 [Acidimicrobiales bacterium]
MPVQQLTKTDAFVVREIPNAPAVGLVRTARKILVSSATDMARSVSYTYGLYGLPIGGASAGLNHDGDGLDDAIAAFRDELAPHHAAGDLTLYAGKGIESSQMAGLADYTADQFDQASAATLVASAKAVRNGDLTGTRIAIEGDPPAAYPDALVAAGAELVTVDGVEKKPWLIWGADADIVLAGSKVGALTHEGVPLVNASSIIAWGPAAVTTKAFALLMAKEVMVVPAFLAVAGGYLLGHSQADDLVGAVDTAFTVAKAADGDSLMIGACKAAEAFIASWTDTKLFGRPFG